MLCQRCGTELPDNYKFCIKCGAGVEQAMQAQPVQPVRNAAPPMQRHFSLEDIARQQQEKNETQLGMSPTPQAPPPAPPKQAPVQQPAAPAPSHTISGPAVPMGQQEQVRFSIFAPDAAEKLEKLKAGN